MEPTHRSGTPRPSRPKVATTDVAVEAVHVGVIHHVEFRVKPCPGARQCLKDFGARFEGSSGRAITSAGLAAYIRHCTFPRSVRVHTRITPPIRLQEGDPEKKPTRQVSVVASAAAANSTLGISCVMPAISSHGDVLLLRAREWRDTVGQSGMTPTAFSFLIPVFVVAIAAPFLCVFCIRKRRQPVPVSTRPPPKIKKPALRRAEAREKLNEVTEVSSRSSIGAEEDEGKPAVETRSVLERECAICLSTLHAPAPPEPAKLSPDTPITDAAALPSTLPPSTDQPQSTDPTTVAAPAATQPPESEAILKLSICGHEFHAECLVSWFVLRKTSCPICRSMYMSKEAMEQHDEEERIALGGAPIVPVADLEAQRVAQPQGPPVSNWRYFLHGRNAFRRAHEERAQGQAGAQPEVEMQNRSAVGAEQQQAGTEVPATVEVQQEPPARSRMQRIFARG